MLHEDGSPPGWRQRARLARCACAEHTGVSGVAQGKVPVIYYLEEQHYSKPGAPFALEL